MIRKYFCYVNVSQRVGSSKTKTLLSLLGEIFENNGGEFLSFSSTTFCTQKREREKKADGRRERKTENDIGRKLET